ARIVPYEENFAVQQVYFLDLADRGIRDIVNIGNGYIILAGPVASGGEFSLYSWDGLSDLRPLMTLSNMNAEGLVNLDKNWLVLSDDGKVKRVDGEDSSGFRSCDRIRRKNSAGAEHPGVFFRAEKFSWKNLPLRLHYSCENSCEKHQAFCPPRK
ncbi:MAG: DUF3616 domain-containing protein, partial [Gammaproteobacteria bacterium]|nr:DUF3616 domain-containing protein [Gammaproteobacteria bacterium]